VIGAKHLKRIHESLSLVSFYRRNNFTVNYSVNRNCEKTIATVGTENRLFPDHKTVISILHVEFYVGSTTPFYHNFVPKTIKPDGRTDCLFLQP
jgi:hypothetical protein